jgi:hypothetical protein
MKIRILSLLIFLLLVTSCTGTIEIGLEPSSANPPAFTVTQPASTANPPAATAIPATLFTEVPQQPSTLLPQLPYPLELQTNPNAPTSTPALQFVQIYLIALEDNGQTGIPVGCGDSAVPVQVLIRPTQGVLRAALEELLSIKTQYYGQSGLYNALYKADLQVESVTIIAHRARVYLTGSLNLGGECDDPRVQAQLEQTVLQFTTVTEADIFINGKPLADAISLKGQ